MTPDDKEKKPEEKQRAGISGTYIAIGVAIGCGIGLVIENLALGIPVGISIGIALDLASNHKK